MWCTCKLPGKGHFPASLPNRYICFDPSHILYERLNGRGCALVFCCRRWSRGQLRGCAFFILCIPLIQTTYERRLGGRGCTLILYRWRWSRGRLRGCAFFIPWICLAPSRITATHARTVGQPRLYTCLLLSAPVSQLPKGLCVGLRVNLVRCVSPQGYKETASAYHDRLQDGRYLIFKALRRFKSVHVWRVQWLYFHYLVCS